eukprot:TRINITY_DN1900_c0_g1_i1.p1 TRINITY_DN1900_c0_g1~~TRINITY_DN1900_c0_g1_i1.p1  ORF type:complete len:471 (-),score=97.63 TRINITY_DN1900_c0_g1_i1:5726-7138(-)
MHIVKASSDTHYEICKSSAKGRVDLIFYISEVQKNIKELEEKRQSQEAALGKLDVEMEVKKLEERKKELEVQLEKLKKEEINYKKWIANVAEQRRIKFEKEKYAKALLEEQIKEKEERKRQAKEALEKEREEERKRKEEEEVKKKLIKEQLVEKYKQIMSGEKKDIDLELDPERVNKEFAEKMIISEPKQSMDETPPKQAQDKFETLAICFDLIDEIIDNLTFTDIVPEQREELRRIPKKETEILSFEEIKAPPQNQKKEYEKMVELTPREERVNEVKWDKPKTQTEIIQSKMSQIFNDHEFSLYSENETISSKSQLLLPIDLALHLSMWQEVTKQEQIANKCLIHVFQKQLNLTFHLQQLRRYFRKSKIFSYLLCNEGDVIHTFLLLVYGEAAFQLSAITAAQLNNAFETAIKMHSKRNVPKIKFVTGHRIPPEKVHMYNTLDVLLSNNEHSSGKYFRLSTKSSIQEIC